MAGIAFPKALACLFGVAEIAIAVCLFLGLFRTVAYGAALALRRFIAGVPVLGACVALFLLRHRDRGILDRQSGFPMCLALAFPCHVCCHART